MMFGTSAPKWVIDKGGANEKIVMFDYVYDLDFKPEQVYYEHESIINAERDSLIIGTHYSYEFKINLFKYSTNPIIVKAKFDEINNCVGYKGSLWLHRDGECLKKKDGTDALFILKEVIPFYRDSYKFRDAAIIRFRSVSPVDLSYGGIQSYQLPNIIITNDF